MCNRCRSSACIEHGQCLCATEKNTSECIKVQEVKAVHKPPVFVDLTKIEPWSIGFQAFVASVLGFVSLTMASVLIPGYCLRTLFIGVLVLWLVSRTPVLPVVDGGTVRLLHLLTQLDATVFLQLAILEMESASESDTSELAESVRGPLSLASTGFLLCASLVHVFYPRRPDVTVGAFAFLIGIGASLCVHGPLSSVDLATNPLTDAPTIDILVWRSVRFVLFWVTVHAHVFAEIKSDCEFNTEEEARIRARAIQSGIWILFAPHLLVPAIFPFQMAILGLRRFKLVGTWCDENRVYIAPPTPLLNAFDGSTRVLSSVGAAIGGFRRSAMATATHTGTMPIVSPTPSPPAAADTPKFRFDQQIPISRPRPIVDMTGRDEELISLLKGRRDREILAESVAILSQDNAINNHFAQRSLARIAQAIDAAR